MGFTGNHVIIFFIKRAHTGIVPEDRDHPVFSVFQLKGRIFNIGFEQGIFFHGFPCSGIGILKNTLECIVVTMVGSGLGNIFKFQIRGFT